MAPWCACTGGVKVLLRRRAQIDATRGAAGGMTAFYDALIDAAKVEPSANNSYVVALTDGSDTKSVASAKDAAAAVATAPWTLLVIGLEVKFKLHLTLLVIGLECTRGGFRRRRRRRVRIAAFFSRRQARRDDCVAGARDWRREVDERTRKICEELARACPGGMYVHANDAGAALDDAFSKVAAQFVMPKVKSADAAAAGGGTRGV